MATAVFSFWHTLIPIENLTSDAQHTSTSLSAEISGESCKNVLGTNIILLHYPTIHCLCFIPHPIFTFLNIPTKAVD